MCGSAPSPAPPPAPIPEKPPSLAPLKEGAEGAGSTKRTAGGTTAAGLLTEQATTSQKTLLGQ